jgi:hypothetical protein
VIAERDRAPSADWPGVVRFWEDLRQSWLDQSGIGLDTTELPVACLIAPNVIGSPWFDDLAQQLIWPVGDAAGQWLALTIDHEEPVSTAIEALEATVRSGWQGMILVRMVREGDRLSLRPITLFGPGAPVDLTLWQRPWRAEAGGQAGGKSGGIVRDWLANLRQRRDRQFLRVQPGKSHVALAEAWRHVRDRAEVGPSLAKMLDDDLAAHVLRLESYGLHSVAERLQAGQERGGLLIAAYALMLARQQRCAVPLLQ